MKLYVVVATLILLLAAIWNSSVRKSADATDARVPSPVPTLTAGFSATKIRPSRERPPLHSAMLAAVAAETDADEKSTALEFAVESALESELPHLLNSLAASSSDDAKALRLLLAERWANSQPADAAAWATQLSENDDRAAIIHRVAVVWAGSDLPAATAWLSATGAKITTADAMLDIAYEGARTEPMAAIELARTLPPSVERDDLVTHAVKQWAAADFTAAAAWSREISDLELRNQLLAAVAIAAAGQDAQSAATLVANEITAGEIQDQAAVSIVQRWAQTAPQAAASWVEKFSGDSLQQAAIENLLTIWQANNPQEAMAWANQLADANLRSLALAVNQGNLQPIGQAPE